LVWTPQKLTKEERQTLEELKESENFNPTPGKTKSFFDRMKNPFG
jgi:molecular chaperone DnaJ